MSDQAFVHRVKGYEKTTFNEDVVGIGWSDADRLSDITDWAEFKNEVRTKYQYKSERTLGNACGSIWRFIHDMKKGDLVVIPLPGRFRVAELLGDDVIYLEKGREEDYAWRRKVRWLDGGKAIPRSHASGYLQARMKCQQTCVSATDLLEDINTALQRSEPISFKQSVLDEVKSNVATHLHKSLTPKNLESLLTQVFKRKGFKAIHLPNRQSKEGDIDVRIEVSLGLEVPIRPLQVGIQVKQHKGVTDKYAVEQVQARLESGDIDRGVVITTGDSFSECAQKLAQELDIDLVAKNDLVEWIISSLGVLD